MNRIYLVLYFSSIQPSNATHNLKTDDVFHIIALPHFTLS